MKRTAARSTYSGNPLTMWTEFAWKTGEMMLASAQVIGHRTSRMAMAGPRPSTRDRKEFTLMGQEKIEAAVESAQAMAAQMLTVNPHLAVRAFQQALAGTTALMSWGSSRTLGQSLARQAKLFQAMTKSAAGSTTQMSGSAARVANKGLKPIHSRATKNAKRLGKR